MAAGAGALAIVRSLDYQKVGLSGTLFSRKLSDCMKLKLGGGFKNDHNFASVTGKAGFEFQTPNPQLKLALDMNALTDTTGAYSASVSPVAQYSVRPGAIVQFGAQFSTDSAKGASFGVGFRVTGKF